MSAHIREDRQAIVVLRAPNVVLRGSGHMAELGITVISEDNDVSIDVKLTRKELTNLVEAGQKLLAGK